MATPDLPDFNMPIFIAGQTIPFVNVNIVAVAVGVIAVDIAAQSVGNIAIDIAAQSLGNVNVNIAASAVTINIQTAPLQHVDTDIIASIQLNINIAAQTLGQVNINIAAQTLGQVNVNIAASAITLNVNIAASAITLNVNITASAITLNVNIASSAVTINVQTAPLQHVDTDIVASIQINVNIAAQTLAVLNINIASQTLGVININITSQAVDLNIKTSGGVNIMIDKLTQSAYLARYSTLQNDNGVATPTAPPLNQQFTYRGKFFPRGARGWLEQLWVYCRRTGAGTITLAMSPFPNAAEIYTVVITPDLNVWNWKSGNIQKMWEYDSLFIWVKACQPNCAYGYDSAVQPIDAIESYDSGVTWTAMSYRFYLRATLYGETVGDIPVSGTLNTVKLPASASQRDSGAVGVPTGDIETDILLVDGSGSLVYALMYTMDDDVDVAIYADGVLVDTKNTTSLNLLGFTALTAIWSLIQFTAGQCTILYVANIEFRRQLRFTAWQNTGGVVNVFVQAVTNTIK